MSVTIPKKYYKGADDNIFHPYYIIAAPENESALHGYVLKIPKQYATITDEHIILEDGNEWNVKACKRLYMFEIEKKIPGHPSKRYRYTEEELIILYGKANSKTFMERLEKREQLYTSGPGKLIRAKYVAYEKHSKYPTEEWLVAPSADAKWAYSLSYNPLKDQGKHNKDAKGFSLLEEYDIKDLSVLQTSKSQLIPLLNELDSVREWKVSEEKIFNCYYNKSGHYVSSSSLAESLALILYDRVPNGAKLELRRYETSECEALRLRLTDLSEEMVRECTDTLSRIKSERLERITKDIQSLIGITIEN